MAKPSILGKLDKTVTVVVGFFVFAMVFTLFAQCYQQFSSIGVYRKEYEGRIVDKAQTIRESDIAPFVTRRFVIESKNGARFVVGVDSEIYNRAEIGMWIKKDSNGVIITSSEPK